MSSLAKISKTSINKAATHPLQTSYWGDFREEWGNRVLYTKYGLLTVHRIPKTNFKLAIFEKGSAPTKKMLQDLRVIAREHNIIFIKLEPNVRVSKKLTKLMRDSGAVPGKTLFTPTTFQIDLTKSEDELMASFHSKTRYNIRLAGRKGVTVEEDNSDKAFNKYIELMRRTVHHQRFFAHSERYHRLMWKHLKKAKIARLLVARHNPTSHKASSGQGGKIITAWVVFVWKDTLYYPYGASDERSRNLMSNNLMMWEAIKFGKKHGLKTFDLWGREPGKGFTKFKEGYNPEVVTFLGTWDLVVNKPLYYGYLLADTARWALLRGRSRFVKPGF